MGFIKKSDVIRMDPAYRPSTCLFASNGDGSKRIWHGLSAFLEENGERKVLMLCL